MFSESEFKLQKSNFFIKLLNEGKVSKSYHRKRCLILSEKFDYCFQLDSINCCEESEEVPALKNVRQHGRHSPVVVEPPDVDVPAAFLVLELSEVLRNHDMVYREDNDIHIGCPQKMY